MSEAFDFGTNYEADYTRPDWDSLTAEQKLQINSGPGWVSNPAFIKDFDKMESFRCHEAGYENEGSNNFRYYFSRNTFIGEEYAKMPAFQRLNILNPNLVKKIEDNMVELNYKPDDELWNDLFQAYKIMRELVDKDDLYFVNEGEEDPDFLTR